MTKLIFCFDGTCNDPADSGDFFSDGSISNVLKLHALFGGKLRPANGKNDKTPGQYSFYYRGVGTRGGWLRQKWTATVAPSGDMRDIIEEARGDLDRNFQVGDEISVFGFSRGAAIARMFAANLAGKYRIEFLGVFDTVAATKNSRDLNADTFPASGILFENGTLGDHVEAAVHLISLDEKRLMFQPTLFNKRKGITEVWFAGVHSDIGGGYWFDGLSDITLEFMLKQAQEKVGLQTLDPTDIDYQSLAYEEEEEGDRICRDDIVVKPLAHGTLHEQQRPKLVHKATLAPRYVRVSIDDLPAKIDDASPLEDYPIIHHTVQERFGKVAGYRPYALRNTKYRIMGAAGKVEVKIRDGVADLGDTRIRDDSPPSAWKRITRWAG